MLSLFGQHDHSHGGHDHAHGDHGHGEAVKNTGRTYLVKQGVTANFEYVLHYAPFEAGEEFEMTLFISEFDSNKPVVNAGLSIEIHGADGSTVDIEDQGDGTYTLKTKIADDRSYTMGIDMAKPMVEHVHIDGITASEKLDSSDEEAEQTSLFNWLTILILGLGFGAGVVFTIIIKRKKTS